jgi:hypothetical protein
MSIRLLSVPYADVLPQHSHVGLAQLLSWIKPQLSVEARPYIVVHADGGCLLSGPRQRDHQAGMRQFVQRLGVGERLQPREDPVRLANRAGDLRVSQQHAR